MRRQVHVHVYTGDSGHWEENKHPRAPDGKFGSGSGGGQEKKSNLAQVPSRHEKEKGEPEGNERRGGPLRKGETGVYLHENHSEADERAIEYEVVGAEEKGRVDIAPVKWDGNSSLRPVENVQGYMVKRASLAFSFGSIR